MRKENENSSGNKLHGSKSAKNHYFNHIRDFGFLERTFIFYAQAIRRRL